MNTGIVSLPDEVLQLVAQQTIGTHLGIRRWCKLASLCKRLWDLQLLPTKVTCSITCDQGEEGNAIPVLHVSVS